MTYGTDYPTPQPTPADPPVGAARGRLPKIILWANVVLGLIVTPLALAGILRVTGLTAYLGAVLLILALLPSNLLRFGWFSHMGWVRALARLRKPLGIGAGVWFVVHSIIALRFFDLSEPLSLLRQLSTGAMATGLLATLVFVALLATSTDTAQRALGRNWKTLHRLVWFAVPLSLVHNVLSNLSLSGSIGVQGVLLFGVLMVFAAVEYFGLRRGRESAWMTHAGLVVAGTIVAVVIWAMASVTVGPWEPAPKGPPPGAEKAPPSKTG